MAEAVTPFSPFEHPGAERGVEIGIRLFRPRFRDGQGGQGFPVREATWREAGQ